MKLVENWYQYFGENWLKLVCFNQFRPVFAVQGLFPVRPVVCHKRSSMIPRLPPYPIRPPNIDV